MLVLSSNSNTRTYSCISPQISMGIKICSHNPHKTQTQSRAVPVDKYPSQTFLSHQCLHLQIQTCHLTPKSNNQTNFRRQSPQLLRPTRIQPLHPTSTKHLSLVIPTISYSSNHSSTCNQTWSTEQPMWVRQISFTMQEGPSPISSNLTSQLSSRSPFHQTCKPLHKLNRM